MATIARERIVKIPSYALCYLINGDSSGLNQEDITAIDTYMEKWYQEARALIGNVVISPNMLDDSNMEEYFTASPAFGLPCAVVDCTILILV